MSASPQLLKWHCRPGVERPLRYARRLLSMGPAEVAARLIAPATPTPLPDWRPPTRSRVAEWLESSFLFGPRRARHIAKTWSRQNPRSAERLIQTARHSLRGWDVFGTLVPLEPGAIDWRSGDTRRCWELSRQQYLFTFGRAFLLTGEPAWARRVATLVEDWRAHNPYPHGVHWSSALEVAVRALSWLWTIPLLIKALDECFLEAWLTGLYEHYQYLKSHLSVYTDPTNHLIGEAAALWMLSVALPDLPAAARHEQRALELLAREVKRQVTPDGVDREQSTGYQRFVLDFCLQVMAQARRSGRSIPPVIPERAAAMAEFLAALRGPGGELPSIGDSDDARAVPFAEPEPDVTPWLGIPDAAPAPPSRSRVFPQGGYCLWQAEQSGRPVALLFDVGPLGLWPNASHGHADALSIQVRVGERWLLGDPGTGAYAACPQLREALRSTAAHNTVTVDGVDQTDALDLFRWLKPVPVRLLETYSDDRYDYALAVHYGYHRLRRPVTHYRSVLFVRPPAPDAGWIVMDRLEGAGRHRCTLQFHFPPGTRFRSEGPRSVLAIAPPTPHPQPPTPALVEQIDARVRPVAAPTPNPQPPTPAPSGALRLSFSEPGWQAEWGPWSRRFGHRESAPVITLDRTVELPYLCLTFLTPLP